jgi:MFS family permease
LIAARGVQGLGGAVVTAVALSLIMDLFTEPDDRAKAMGIYGFVCAAGGSIGVLLGGVLVAAFSWHWVFLVNLPIGIVVYVLCGRLLPEGATTKAARLDVAGAITVTLGSLLAVYAVVNGNTAGWTSTRTLGMLAAAALLLVTFLCIEARTRAPLMPLGLFRLRNLATANVVAVLWAAAMFAWFFISALYMQLVLGYDALQIGLAFLPADLIMGAFSLGISARVVMRFGIRAPIIAGMLLVAAGLGLFARTPVHAGFWLDVFPGMALLGLGAGMALNPLLLAAMNDVEADQSGLASGIVNTSFMMGGAFGLAVLASLAAAVSATSLGSGAEQAAALTDGYRAAFGAGAVFAVIAALLGAVLLRTSEPARASDGAPAVKAFDQA